MMVTMFTLYFGTDTTAVRAATLTQVAKVSATGAVVSTIDADRYAAGMLADAAGASSLFGEAMCFVLDTPSADPTFLDDVYDHLEVLAESPHTFIVIEGALLADAKKKYAKHAADVLEYKAASAERYNVFALADSLAKKDKKTLWMQLMEAQAAGLSAEEIIGTLWWQLKSLRLAAMTNSAEAAGMKEYPYQKAKRSLGAFKPGELETLSHTLLAVYHDGHGGVRDIDAALEQWVLGL